MLEVGDEGFVGCCFPLALYCLERPMEERFSELYVEELYGFLRQLNLLLGQQSLESTAAMVPVVRRCHPVTCYAALSRLFY